jgi:hypothetical protein
VILLNQVGAASSTAHCGTDQPLVDSNPKHAYNPNGIKSSRNLCIGKALRRIKGSWRCGNRIHNIVLFSPGDEDQFASSSPTH